MVSAFVILDFMPVDNRSIAAVIACFNGACLVSGHINEALISCKRGNMGTAYIIPQSAILQRKVHIISAAVSRPGGAAGNPCIDAAAGKIIACPGSTVPHVQIYLSVRRRIEIGNIALEIGVFCIQSQVDFRFSS